MFGGDMMNMYNQVVDDLKEAYKEIDDLKQKLQRKDNIINELEKTMCDLEYQCRFDNAMWGTIVIIHNKLKELKGE